MQQQNIESAEVVLEKMWSKNPFFMLIIILMLVPLICSFIFGFYILQANVNNMNKVSETIVAIKIELEKQTSVLNDVKDQLEKYEYKNFSEDNKKKKSSGGF